MKKITKLLLPIICLLLFLTACNTTTTKAPIIYGVVNEITLFVGESFDPLEYLQAFDESGKDVTDKIEIIGSIPLNEEMILTTAGEYTYYIVVSQNGKYIINEEVNLTVVSKPDIVIDTEKPIINANYTYSFSVGDKLIINVTATDNVDGDITNRLVATGLDQIPTDENSFLTKVGTYQVTYQVKDNAQNTQTKTITIIVTEKSIYDEIIRNEIIADEFQNVEMPIRSDGYKIIWADEFDYTGAPNSDYWSYDIGTGDWGWGNDEKQYYTSRSQNVYVENGLLRITALREAYAGSQYTSTRLVTKQKVDIKYGRIEVKAKLPSGGGTWPAIWMLSTNSSYGGWPNGGEIDIMEHVGNNQDYILGTTHTGAKHGGNSIGGTIHAPGVSEKFNVYGIEWTPDSIKFFMNDNIYFTYSNPKYSTNNYLSWPYDQNFHLLLNVAMGGILGGNISSNFTSSSMEVDYVRFYQKDYTENDNLAPEVVTVTNKNATSSTITLNWNKVSDNVGLRHYEIILNGVQVGATSKTNYTIKNLNPGTDYHVQVLAVDLADNYSTSGNMIITTQANQRNNANNQLMIIKQKSKENE